VRFIPGFGDSSLDFTLICQVKEFVDQYLAQHELRKRIFKRFKEEGIEIPFPHRTVYLREEKEWKR
jgi:small-conductance mechanosensitive channel